MAAVQRSRPILDMLAGYAVIGLDVANAADITITGAGVSTHADSIGTYDVLQTTDANRPIYSNAGPLSYYDGAAGARRLISAAGTDLTGGDMCLISISKFNATATSRAVFASGSASTARTRLVTAAAGSFFGAIVVDSVGNDIITGPASDTAIHMQILRCVSGSVRKLHVDGGAGTAGARTTAVFNTHTHAAVLATTPGTGSADAKAYLHALCKPTPPAWLLNIAGEAYWSRFASLGATWSTLS